MWTIVSAMSDASMRRSSVGQSRTKGKRARSVASSLANRRISLRIAVADPLAAKALARDEAEVEPVLVDVAHQDLDGAADDVLEAAGSSRASRIIARSVAKDSSTSASPSSSMLAKWR